MNHLELVNLFRSFAKQHRSIKHSIAGRHSFFRMNKEAEIINQLNVGVDYPVLLLQEVSGSMMLTGDVSDNFSIVFEIRKKVDSNGDFDQEELVKSECKEIGQNIIAWIDHLCEEEGSCGPIENFDINQVQWEFTGPINENEFGCRFRFFFRKGAYNQFKLDLDEIFITEFFVPLCDYDGQPLLDWDDEPLNDLE